MKAPLFRLCTALAFAPLLSSCGLSPSDAGSPPAAAPNAAISDTLTDPGSGAQCGGKHLMLTRDNAVTVIDGECGDVTITASGGTLNFDKARSIRLDGSHFTVLNQQVDTVHVAGNDNVLNLTNARRIEVTGNNNMISGTQVEQVQFRGSNNAANLSSEPQIDDAGTGNRVI